MPARILSIPFLVIAVLIFYFVNETGDKGLAVWMLVPLVFLAFLYAFSSQINWWWYKKYSRGISKTRKTMLEQANRMYTNLTDEAKGRFEHRVTLHLTANEFIGNGFKTFPEDLKTYIISYPVMMTYGLENYLMPSFNRLVIYPHPFPSPQYPEKLHASEIHYEDGALIFSAEQVMQAVLTPDRFYNVAIHEWAKAFVYDNKTLKYPDLGEDIWDQLFKISRFSKTFIENCVGLPDLDLMPVTINLFFTFPWKFKANLPQIYDQFVLLFNQDPTKTENPILDFVMAGKDF